MKKTFLIVIFALTCLVPNLWADISGDPGILRDAPEIFPVATASGQPVYGLVGDGVDKTSIFNTAISRLNASLFTSGVLNLPPGNYVVSGLDKLIRAGIIIRGSGAGTNIYCGGSEPCFTLGDSAYSPHSIIFEDLTLRTQSASTPAALVRATNARDVTFNRVQFYGTPKIGVENIQGFNINLNNCRFNGYAGDIGVLNHYHGSIPTTDASVATTDVDATANVITVGSGTRCTGGVMVFSTTGTPPAPLRNGYAYFVIRNNGNAEPACTNNTEVKLAYTEAYAKAGTAIDLTSQGTGTHSLTGLASWSNANNIRDTDFDAWTASGAKAIVYEGGGGYQISGGMIEGIDASGNGHGIYVDLSAGHYYLNSLLINGVYFEDNEGYAFYLNDLDTNHSAKNIVFLNSRFYGDAAGASAVEKVYLGSFGRGTFIGNYGHEAGDLAISAGANTAYATLIDNLNWTVDNNVTVNMVSGGGDLYSKSWTDYAPSSTIVGWSSLSYQKILYKRIGKLVYVNFALQGTSDTTTATFTLPYALSSSINIRIPIKVEDNGVNQSYPGLAQLPGGSATVACYKTLAFGAFTIGNEKLVEGQFVYEIQ